MDVGILMFVHASLVIISFLCRSANMTGVLNCLVLLFGFECFVYGFGYIMVKIRGVSEESEFVVSNILSDIGFALGISIVSLISVVIVTFS